MNKLLLGMGRLTGVVGVAVCVLAVAARITRHYRMAGFEAGTLLQGGVAAMVLACLCFAACQAERRN